MGTHQSGHIKGDASGDTKAALCCGVEGERRGQNLCFHVIPCTLLPLWFAVSFAASAVTVETDVRGGCRYDSSRVLHCFYNL